MRTLFDCPSHTLTPSQFILSLSPILCSFTPPEMALVDYAATNDRDDGGADQVVLAAEGGGEDNAGVAAAAASGFIQGRSFWFRLRNNQ